jgi:hypothetical protein
MSPRNATRPAAVRTASGPRETDQLGGKIDLVANKPTAKKQDLSSMQAAFLGALVDLAQRGDAEITPLADVAPDELREAVVALVRAKGERGAE